MTINNATQCLISNKFSYGCESVIMNVFDSLLPAVSSSTEQQTAAILCLAPDKTEIILRYSNCKLVTTLPLCV